MTSSPITYSVDRANHRVTARVSSQPSFKNFSDFLNCLLADPAFHTGDDLLWDRRAATEPPTREVVENVTRLMREHRHRIGAGRVAFVVSAQSPAHFGMARMLQIVSDWGEAFRIFTTLSDAVAWLDEGLAADRAAKKRD